MFYKKKIIKIVLQVLFSVENSHSWFLGFRREILLKFNSKIISDVYKIQNKIMEIHEISIIVYQMLRLSTWSYRGMFPWGFLTNASDVLKNLAKTLFLWKGHVYSYSNWILYETFHVTVPLTAVMCLPTWLLPSPRAPVCPAGARLVVSQIVFK